ncbi:MAG: haloacid dehalogenase [Thermoplasmata archaeon]|nr:MAG: haloacid dehalogenase [Thermoplasmata archaeon]
MSHCAAKKREEGKVEHILPQEVAFDIDGVLADTFRVFVETARNQYHVQVAYEDITEYDFRKVIDIDMEIARDIIQRILDQPIQMGIMPMEGAVEVLNLLAGEGPILLVTARPGRPAIYEWVVEHLKGIDHDLICVEATGTHEEKIPILVRQGIKYFVEDRLDTCYLLASANVTPIVFEQPWNQKPHPFIRVRSWEDIKKMIAWSRSSASQGNG